MEAVTWQVDRSGDTITLTLSTGGESDARRIYDRIMGNLMSDDFIPFNLEPTIEKVHEDFEVSEEEKHCCICMETREDADICKLNCEHTFCKMCIDSHVKSKNVEVGCPICRADITCIKYKN